MQGAEAVHMTPNLIAGTAAELPAGHLHSPNRVIPRQAVALGKYSPSPASVDLAAAHRPEEPRTVVMQVGIFDRNPPNGSGPRVDVDRVAAGMEDPEPPQRDILRARMDPDRGVGGQGVGTGIAEGRVQRHLGHRHLAVDGQRLEARLHAGEVQYTAAGGKIRPPLQDRLRRAVAQKRHIRRDVDIDDRVNAPWKVQNAASGVAQGI